MYPQDLEIDGPALAALCAEFHLNLVILFGSRADSRPHADSDSDIGITRPAGRLSPDRTLELQFRLSQVIRPGVVDLVDLERASGLLRHIACEQGVVLYEGNSHAFEHFRLRAWNQYQDERIQIRRHDSAAIRNALRSLAG